MSKERGGVVRSKPSWRFTLTCAITALICISASYICYTTMSLGAGAGVGAGAGAGTESTISISSDRSGVAKPSVSKIEYTNTLIDDTNTNAKASSSSRSDSGKVHNHDYVHSDLDVMRCPFPGGDAQFCDVPPPKTSHFRFPDAPHDAKRWRAAQILASSGEQVLLKRVVEQFPQPFDYLDGDRSFRGLQKLVDIFVDSKTGLQALLPEAGKDAALWSPIRRSRKLRSQHVDEDKNFFLVDSGIEREPDDTEKRTRTKRTRKSTRLLQEKDPNDELINSGDTIKALHINGKQIAPLPYNFRVSNRAPLVEMGYTAFDKNLNSYFSGNFVGGNFVKKEWFFDRWHDVKSRLDFPFITMCALNENWGVLSTNFPNRTAGWGACCNKPSDKKLHEFLAHDKTLMFIINQHSNLSHPKLLTLPRGLPMQWEHTARVVWDTQRDILKNVKKQKLLFAASSSWGKRPQILRCISNKMAIKDFWGHSDASLEHKEDVKKAKTNRRLYYEKLGSAIFGVALPGLGYDCFRTWELLSMGSMVVLERGVGLDRTLWRLPALLVEDFYDITPQLLRSAYVEAIYRADEFEFERLTQSFWYSVIANVSYSKSLQPMLDKFPMEAELTNFARPKEPYACSNTNTCGPGTKRTPRNMC